VQRDPRLAPLSEEHHHGLVFALRIERELPGATDEEVERLYAQLLRFWSRGLLPHFHTESECLLARLIRHRPVDDPQIERLNREHLSMYGLVARMRDATGPGARREALRDFGVTLHDHIRWEERELFEAAQAELAEAELDALGTEIEERHPKLTSAPWEDSSGG
jgi:hemerythrin-like domain-containing protein